MAVVIHLANHSDNYQSAVNYLMFKHDEVTGKALKDTSGNRILREDILMDGINCKPFSFALECKDANKQWGKNRAKGDIETHHYIISFDPRDSEVASIWMRPTQCARSWRRNGSAVIK